MNSYSTNSNNKKQRREWTGEVGRVGHNMFCMTAHSGVSYVQVSATCTFYEYRHRYGD